jgi:micrococcal nuclease
VTVQRAPTSLVTPSGPVGQADTAASPVQTPAEMAALVNGPGALEPNAKVVAITDGDTIIIRYIVATDAKEKVRLIGIDTPETKRPGTPIECFGPEATQFITELLPVDTLIRIERDVEFRDRYGRLLAYVYRAYDGLFINDALARYGYAQQLTYPPNVAYADTFSEAVEEARNQNRGLWQGCPATVT